MPLIQGLYGTKTYWVNGVPAISKIAGTEILPYTPPISGTKMTIGESSSVFASHNKKVWWLRNGDYVLSRSCEAFSAYPESAIIGELHDGMILDMTGGQRLWQLNASDPSDCHELNTGEGDSHVFLIQVQDVRLPDRHVSDHWPAHKEDMKWHTYKNAILMWEVEPKLTIPEFELVFEGLDELLGIRLPTSEERRGWPIDDLLIWGKNVGLLVQGDVLQDTGKFEVGMYLMSQDPWPKG